MHTDKIISVDYLYVHVDRPEIVEVVNYPTTNPELLYTPQLAVSALNDKDFIHCVLHYHTGVSSASVEMHTVRDAVNVTKVTTGNKQFSESNWQAYARDLSACNHPITCLEIGTGTPDDTYSTTWTFMKYAPAGSQYVGVDKNMGKISAIRNFKNHSEVTLHAINCLSTETNILSTELASIGIDEFDILFIDGNHSVNSVLHDFTLTSYLKRDGAVYLHDTAIHPGPRLLLSAINPDYYTVTDLSPNKPDNGLARLKRNKDK